MSKNIRKHLAITSMSYLFFGCGLSVQQLGLKAGLPFWFVIIFWLTSCVVFFIVVFTSMQKVKDALGIGAKKDEKLFEFENDSANKSIK